MSQISISIKDRLASTPKRYGNLQITYLKSASYSKLENFLLFFKIFLGICMTTVNNVPVRMVRSRPLPSKLFLVHHSSVILSSEAIYSRLWRRRLNNTQPIDDQPPLSWSQLCRSCIEYWTSPLTFNGPHLPLLKAPSDPGYSDSVVASVGCWWGLHIWRHFR